MFSRFAASAVLFALLAVAQAHEGIDNSGQIGGQRDGISAPSGGGGGGSDLFLEDGSSFLLLEDGTSKLCLESGC